MDHPPTRHGFQLQSLVTANGELQIRLVSVETAPLAADEVLVRVEAAPINPSDIGLLFGAADMATLQVAGSGVAAVATARVPDTAMKGMAGRLGQAMAAGNEGAGVVIEAGASVQALLGKAVAVLGGAMYAQYRVAKADQCLLLPPGATAADGASCFVNPLTVLGMVETMKREGHAALVHTAAASNLGQMLNRICIQDQVALVNIVRTAEQEALLRSQGAVRVCNTASPGFMEELTQALVDTGATLAFDATGGGKLAGQILGCMEAALNRSAKVYSRYGSTTHKQVYLYGGLDTSPTTFQRNFGMAWGMGGWLLFPFLQRIGSSAAQALKQRVAAELKTTFASSYTRHISLAEVLQADMMQAYGRRATGAKYLVNPNQGLAHG